jgi:hypothetical protein
MTMTLSSTTESWSTTIWSCRRDGAAGLHRDDLDSASRERAVSRQLAARTTRAEGLRQALFAWAFNPAIRDTDPPPEIAAALDWAERASLPIADLEDTATARLALAACARNLHLPKNGWGRIVPAAPASRAGTAWTDDGTSRRPTTCAIRWTAGLCALSCHSRCWGRGSSCCGPHNVVLSA